MASYCNLRSAEIGWEACSIVVCIMCRPGHTCGRRQSSECNFGTEAKTVKLFGQLPNIASH